LLLRIGVWHEFVALVNTKNIGSFLHLVHPRRARVSDKTKDVCATH